MLLIPIIFESNGSICTQAEENDGAVLTLIDGRRIRKPDSRWWPMDSVHVDGDTDGHTVEGTVNKDGNESGSGWIDQKPNP
jgi:hypothetical protein